LCMHAGLMQNTLKQGSRPQSSFKGFLFPASFYMEVGTH
jgi:hypothetical protein